MAKYLISSEFTVLRKGTFVAASDSAGEFVLDTDSLDLAVATMQEIAAANKFKLEGKKKSEIAASLIAGLETLNVPVMEKKPMSVNVQELVKSGVDAGQSEDEILISLVQAGVKFAAAQKAMKEAMVTLGLVVSRKDVRETVFADLGDNFVPETYAEIEERAAKIANDKITAAQAQAHIRAYLKEHERAIPKKEKTAKAPRAAKTTAWAAHHTAVFDWILANPNATEADLVAALPACGKKVDDEKSRVKFVGRYMPIIELVRRARG